MAQVKAVGNNNSNSRTNSNNSNNSNSNSPDCALLSENFNNWFIKSSKSK